MILSTCDAQEKGKNHIFSPFTPQQSCKIFRFHCETLQDPRLSTECVHTYLIFVIFFTLEKFLENKIYTEKRQFFRVKSVKNANFLC